MSKTYEELSGAEGRARFFRPTRHTAKSIFAGAAPRVYFDEREFALNDISGVGVGCSRALDSEDADLGAVNDRGVLRLVQRGQEIFRGEARQARLNIAAGRAVTGFALEGAFIDLTSLRRRNAHALAIAAPVSESAGVTPEYKALCADAMEFVGDLLMRIDRHIAPIEDTIGEAESNEIIAEIEAAVTDRWWAILMAGNAMVRGWQGDVERIRAAKTYTERTLTRLLVGGESWARSYYKPAGYPGDYKIMNFMYDRTPIGSSLREKLLHMLGVVAGQPIVSRMHKLAELIVELGEAAAPADRPAEIMSIGAGPARELERVVELSSAERKWRATLIDQDADAIEFAVANIRRCGLDTHIETRPLNLTFREMLQPSAISQEFANKDVIYSSGFVDYLNPMLAMRFVKRLYDFLRPGGSIIIGNVNDLETGTLWPMEYILDWTLYFRTEEEMRAMATLTSGADVRIVSDAMNAIYLLVITKPAR